MINYQDLNIHSKPEHQYQAPAHLTATVRALAMAEIFNQVIPTHYQRSDHTKMNPIPCFPTTV
jgi:hypothetical protein